MPVTQSAPGLAQPFALILDGLCNAVAARMSRPRSARDVVAFPLLMLLWTRLRRATARFTALAARAAVGTAARRRPLHAFRPARPPRPPDRLPRGFGWLIRLLPEAACHGSQLHHLLTGPDMKTLLEMAPQAGRILRPLCQMLAVPAPARPPPAGNAASSSDRSAPDAATTQTGEAPALPVGAGADRTWRPACEAGVRTNPADAPFSS